MLAWYKIVQEAGPRARASAGRYGMALPRKVGMVQAEGQLDALQEYVHQTYLTTGNRQYAGCESYYRSHRGNEQWKLWDGRMDPHDKQRDWSVVVTLRNGERNTHTIRLLAWTRTV